ncbi:hypothetical protein LRS14_22520 [Aquincola sp. J276]|nr:hypothetical protein [Aquincola sp. J276]MCR5867922.1 hypothetical protein [Aquincola sp. J276]
MDASTSTKGRRSVRPSSQARRTARSIAQAKAVWWLLIEATPAACSSRGAGDHARVGGQRQGLQPLGLQQVAPRLPVRHLGAGRGFPLAVFRHLEAQLPQLPPDHRQALGLPLAPVERHGLQRHHLRGLLGMLPHVRHGPGEHRIGRREPAQAEQRRMLHQAPPQIERRVGRQAALQPGGGVAEVQRMREGGAAAGALGGQQQHLQQRGGLGRRLHPVHRRGHVLRHGEQLRRRQQGRRPPVHQHARHRQVPVLALGRVHQRQGGLLHLVVAEVQLPHGGAARPVRMQRAGPGGEQQVLLQQRQQLVVQRLAVDAQRAAEQRLVDGAAHAGAQAHQRLRPGIQALELLRQHRQTVLAGRQRGQGRHVPMPAAVGAPQLAGVEQLLHLLQHLELVSAGALVQHAGQVGHFLGRGVQHVRHHLAQAGRAQATQRHRHLLQAAGGDVGQRLAQARRQVGLGVAVGAQQQHAAMAFLGGDAAQQQQRVVVGPLQVVEEQQQRRAELARGAKQRRQRHRGALGHGVQLLRLAAGRGCRRARLAVDLQQRPERRHQLHQRAGLRAQRRAQQLARGHQLRIGPGPPMLGQLRQRIHQAGAGLVAAVLVVLARHQQHAPRRQHRHERLHQGGLAGARGAMHPHHAALAGRRIDRGEDLAELVVAVHQPRRRRGLGAVVVAARHEAFARQCQQLLQVPPQAGMRLVAVLRPLGQQLVDQCGDATRQRGIQHVG